MKQNTVRIPETPSLGQVMNRTRTRAALAIWTAIALGSSLAACEDEKPLDRIRIQLVAANDSSPIGQGEASLFDLAESRYQPPVAVDSEGRATLWAPAPGTYVPVVRAPGYEVFALPQSEIRLGRKGRTLDLRIPLVAMRPETDTGIRLEGQVLDARTGLPIAGAQVEMTSPDDGYPNFSEYDGDRGATEPVTDADGHFVLDPVPLRPIFPGESQPMTGDLRVRAAGYRSAWIVGWSRFQVPAEVTIRLQRGEDVGLLFGRVVDPAGDPVAGADVRAEWRASPPPRPVANKLAPRFTEDPSRPSSLLLPSVGITDLEGRYELTGMPPGSFHVRAGVSTNDGLVSKQGRQVFLDPDSSSVEVADLEVYPAVTLRTPASGATIETDRRLGWWALSETSSYLVTLQRGDGAFAQAHTDTTSVDLPADGDFLQPGAWYRWEVLGLDAADQAIAGSERRWLFRLAESASP
jgi:protocatechuate 3,4-dioxygenase beta subunit